MKKKKVEYDIKHMEEILKRCQEEEMCGAWRETQLGKCDQGMLRRPREKPKKKKKERKRQDTEENKAKKRRETVLKAVLYGGVERRASISAMLLAKSRQGQRHQSTQEIRK